MKPKKKRDPVARELMCSGKYGQRIINSKKIYTRKEKHRKSSDKRYSELFHFCRNALILSMYFNPVSYPIA